MHLEIDYPDVERLIRELMDEVQIESSPGKTVVLMRKYVECAP
mgnify:CR=1 FL=1